MGNFVTQVVWQTQSLLIIFLQIRSKFWGIYCKFEEIERGGSPNCTHFLKSPQ